MFVEWGEVESMLLHRKATGKCISPGKAHAVGHVHVSVFKTVLLSLGCTGELAGPAQGQLHQKPRGRGQVRAPQGIWIRSLEAAELWENSQGIFSDWLPGLQQPHLLVLHPAQGLI